MGDFRTAVGGTILFSTWTLRQVRAGQLAYVDPVFCSDVLVRHAHGCSVIAGDFFVQARHCVRTAVYLSYGMICFLLTQILERTTHLRQLATAFVVYGAGMAMFAVLQSLSSSGKLYWIRTPHFGGWIYGPTLITTTTPDYGM